MKARHVQVDGTRLHLVEAGEGPALVLLHGLAATHVNWEHTIAAFADRWRVIAPDLPGHGASAKPNAPYTIDFYAGLIRSLGRELGVREAVVAGNSLGGQIAIELGATYPGWTRALVLAAPAGGFGRTLRTVWPLLGPVVGPWVLRNTLPRALDRCFFEPSGPAHAMRRHVLETQLAAPDFPDFARAVARSIGGAVGGGTEGLARLQQPTLIVWGRDDRLTPVAGGRRMQAAVPHARLVTIERCGHLPVLEQPRRFNEALAGFLRQVDAAPRRGARRANGGTRCS
jgi:pimeloyl-ACP methyl ester carboxylesterase